MGSLGGVGNTISIVSHNLKEKKLLKSKKWFVMFRELYQVLLSGLRPKAFRQPVKFIEMLITTYNLNPISRKAYLILLQP